MDTFDRFFKKIVLQTLALHLWQSLKKLVVVGFILPFSLSLKKLVFEVLVSFYSAGQHLVEFPETIMLISTILSNYHIKYVN